MFIKREMARLNFRVEEKILRTYHVTRQTNQKRHRIYTYDYSLGKKNRK